MVFSLGVLAAAGSLIVAATAASFPPTPEGVTVIESEGFPGVSISYKQVMKDTHR